MVRLRLQWRPSASMRPCSGARLRGGVREAVAHVYCRCRSRPAAGYSPRPQRCRPRPMAQRTTASMAGAYPLGGAGPLRALPGRLRRGDSPRDPRPPIPFHVIRLANDRLDEVRRRPLPNRPPSGNGIVAEVVQGFVHLVERAGAFPGRVVSGAGYASAAVAFGTGYPARAGTGEAGVSSKRRRHPLSVPRRNTNSTARESSCRRNGGGIPCPCLL